MVSSRFKGWLRCVLTTGLCYALFLQILLVQAVAVKTDTGLETAICHGNGEQNQNEPGGAPSAQCHFCLLPGASVALLPDDMSGAAIFFVAAASAYSVFSSDSSIVKPPPRGASRAPPAFA